MVSTKREVVFRSTGVLSMPHPWERFTVYVFGIPVFRAWTDLKKY